MTKRSNPALWLLSLGNGGVDRPFNDAVGGTVTEIDDYNGSGEKWRVHTFTGNGTLDISVAVQPFRVLIVGGGGASKFTANSGQGGGGAGGAGSAGSGGPGKASNITGSSVTYARGGGSDGWDGSQQYGAGGNFGGLAAQPGVVIVAYRIG